MAKLFFIIALTLWISTTLGMIIHRNFKLGNPIFSGPMGFATLIAGLQLLYYPAQLFNWPSLYIHGVSFTVYAILLAISIKYAKSIVLEYLNLKTLWVLIYVVLFVFLFYKVSIAIPRSDSQMYLNYVSQNINIDHLNLFNLWTGEYGKEFVTVYLFQGYYHFSAFFIYFVNSFYTFFGIGGYIENIVVVMWGMGLMYAVISGLAIVNFINSFKYKKTWTEHVLLFFTLLFTNMYYWKISFAFYGNTWRSLWMASLMFYLYKWIEEENPHYRWAAAIAFGASIASSSSSLFIGFAILYGLAYYLVVSKRKNVFRDLSYIAIPMVLFVLAIKFKDAPNQLIVLLPITIVFYAFHRKLWFANLLGKLEFFLEKNAVAIFVIAIPLLAITYSFYDMKVDPNYPWNFFHYFDNHAAYDMMKDYIFIHSTWMDNTLNVLRWWAVYILLRHYTDRNENKYIQLHFLMLAVLFLNPLTTSFISKNFASNVYYRSFEALFNVFSEVVLFGVLLNHYSNKKWVYRGIAFVLVFAVLFSHVDSLILKDKMGQYGFYVVEGETVLPLYKIKNSEYDAIKNFQSISKEYMTDNKQITVVSHADGLRTFMPDVYQVFTARQYWSAWDRIDQDFYAVAQMLYGWDERPKVDYSLSCSYLVKYKIDFVINEVWENDEFDQAINACTTVRYENYEYRVRVVNR